MGTEQPIDISGPPAAITPAAEAAALEMPVVTEAATPAAVEESGAPSSGSSS